MTAARRRLGYIVLTSLVLGSWAAIGWFLTMAAVGR